MKHDGLNMDEIIHYGTLGMIKGLSPEIAERFNSHLSNTKAEVNEKMADEIEELKETISEVASLVSRYD